MGGETIANQKGIIQGQSDTELSDVGLKQAQLAASRLQYEPFTHVFSSDLSRARQTAQIIVEGSKACKCPISQDARLRERKFGIMEGKCVKEHKEMAQKAGKTVVTYTPLGAETTEQVRQRVILFFQELCQLIQRESQDEEPMVGQPCTIKRRRYGSTAYGANSPEGSVFPSDFPYEAEQHSTLTQQTQNKGSNKPIPNCDSQIDLVMTKGSTSSTTSGCSSMTDNEVQAAEISANGPDLDPQQPGRSGSPVFQHSTCDDADIKALVTSSSNAEAQQHYVCPNVSLSPLVEHRLERISSISSGRNSFDDGDVIPPIVANVLIASHGGCLKELIRHFVDDLECKVFGGRGHALRVSPNTGLSRFTITLSEFDDKPKVTCLLIHDKDHLNGYELDTETEGNL
ncbi:fructose-2,6-bisphosphatase TIGAR isoform X2 [Lingula anatina]|uniref:Fructose-2,6-bisphosphatase TIGAR isoform X2 n=1 Tax=Lingula anatina TaxID=7574 RepID=A0A1S3JRI9_LINAN|nr:fructose-2,6-bisphosphatase TIGAR isoform X2 [Lingula anatina]|eukprot:XP_013413023.1 fructose-2,6-bisphosphatase TIGAR isoform X2 [Lingula anatina]